jgi:hypothetical protein
MADTKNLKFNGTTIDTVKYNGTEYDHVKVDDVTYFQKQAVAPSIAFVSRTTTTLTFDITNNDDRTASVYVRLDDGSWDYIGDVASGQDIQHEFETLTEGTSYVPKAYVTVNAKINSDETVESSQLTTPTAPSITYSSKTAGSVTWSFTNNSNAIVALYAKLGAASYVLLDTLANGESVDEAYTNLSRNTGYISYAYVRLGGVSSAETTSATVTTNSTVEEPVISFSSDTENSITVNYENKVGANVTFYLDCQTGSYDTTPDGAGTYDQSFSVSAFGSGTKTITGLSSSTTYYISARVLYGGAYSTVDEFTETTDAPAVTATPNITNVSVDNLLDSFSFDVTNLDATDATLYSDYNDSTPDRWTDTNVAFFDTGDTHNSGTLSPGSFTIYAKAQAGAKPLSAYDSQSVTIT